MKTTGNTILITGGGSGIGRALAHAFHTAGHRVIVAGRRRQALEETAQGHEGMAVHLLDASNAQDIATFANQVTEAYPNLDVLINNAGIMRYERLDADSVDLADAEETIATNLLGPIRLTAALLPHLRDRPKAAIVTVSSGLAFVPLAHAPTYCATKAAIHSWSQALRTQLRGTNVQVIEWAPPLVATDLQPDQKDNPRAMPLAEFIAESVALFEANPEAEEILVERVKPLRDAEREGRYGEAFAMLNPTV